MKRATVLAALLLSKVCVGQDNDKPLPLPEPVVRSMAGARLFYEDGGVEDHGPGIYFNQPAAIIVAQKYASLEAERDSLKKAIEQAPPPGLSVKAVAVLFILALGGGFAAAKLVK